MIAAFLTWWLDQLAQLLPRWLRRPAFGRVNAVVIRPTTPLDRAGTLGFFSRHNGRETPLGDFPARLDELRQVPARRGRPGGLGIGGAELVGKNPPLPPAGRRPVQPGLAF